MAPTRNFGHTKGHVAHHKGEGQERSEDGAILRRESQMVTQRQGMEHAATDERRPLVRSRFLTAAPALLLVLLVGSGLALWGCGTETASSTSESAPTSGSSVSTTGFTDLSFEETWAASLAALEGLGPTRVSIVETTQGRITGDEIPPEQSEIRPQTEEAEQLLDSPGARARLTVRTSDGAVETIVVNGREKTSTRSGSLTTSQFVSVSRYISLEAPEGLPLPLWAGNAVGPTQGYADLFAGDTSGAGGLPADGTVERQPDGGLKLSWQHAAKGMTLDWALLLDSRHLPVRIEIAGEGTPEEGDLQGLDLEYSTTIEYQYEQVPAFSDSDFVLDVPPNAYREGVTYELSLERPQSERAEWGQYWLGEAVGDWKLTRAEYALHEDSPELGSGAEPRDEGVFLIYERPDKTSPNENIQMIVRQPEGRYFEDARKFAEDRVASGGWQRQEMTLAGQPAILYSGSLEGGADSRIDSIYVFLPDAFVNIEVWAPVDPLLVLEALSPIE